MKRNLNRGISLLLTVCLVLGIFASSGITLVRAEDAEPTVETVLSPNNLIANGNFGETRDVNVYPNLAVPEGWASTNTSGAADGFVMQVTDAFAQDGTNSMHITGTSGTTINFCKNYEHANGNDADNDGKFADYFAAGDVLVFKAWVRGTVTKTGFRFGVEFRDVDGKSDKDSGKTLNTKSLFTVPVGDYYDWTEFVWEITVPEGAGWVRVKPLEVPNAFVGDIYVDNLTVTVNDEPLFTDTSFEEMEGYETTLVENALFLTDEGWTGSFGNADNVLGSVGVVVDPDDALNGVLEVNDESAQPLDEAGNPIPLYNEDGTPKTDDKGNQQYEQGSYVTAHFGGFAVDAGKTYTFTMKVKFANSEDAQTLTVNLRGNAHDSKGKVMKTLSFKGTDGEEWQEKTVTFTVPDDVTTFYVKFNTGKNMTGIVYVDDVILSLDCDHAEWSEPVTTGGITCESPTVSVKTCTACGATHTTTTNYPHNWVRGVCSVCGEACEHNAPEGKCTVCLEELPASWTETELFNMGALQTGGTAEVTTYGVTENWQLKDWYLRGSWNRDGISVQYSNAWSTDGEWSLHLVDTSYPLMDEQGNVLYDENNKPLVAGGAVSVNLWIPVDITEAQQITLSADIKAVSDHVSFYVAAYDAMSEDTAHQLTCTRTISDGTVQEINSIGPSAANMAKGGSMSATGTIPVETKYLYVRISTGANNTTPVEAYLDNLKITMGDSDANLLGDNASFEVLPIGAKPVTTTVTNEIVPGYASGSRQSVADGWSGVGDIADKYKEVGYVEELTWELDEEGNPTDHAAVFHFVDADASTGYVSYYWMHNLKKSTTYTLKFDAKRVAYSDDPAVKYDPMVTVAEMNSAGAVTKELKKEYQRKDGWNTYEYDFTTTADDFAVVRLGISSNSKDSLEAWYDNFSVVEKCNHTWKNPIVVDATCVNKASRTVTCSNCGAVGVTEYGAIADHAWAEADCTAPDRCTNPGCGETANEPLDHDCSKIPVEAGATGECGRCGKEIGHKWTDEEGNSNNGVCFRCEQVCPHTSYVDGVCSVCGAAEPGCAHEYDDGCDWDCNLCGEYREPPHNITDEGYVAAVVPANCTETGHPEYWTCADCGGYFTMNSIGGYTQTNPAWLYYSGDHVRPEGSAACAVVTCDLCGQDSYGTESCVRAEGTYECQDGTCVNCGGVVYGSGHSYGYDENGVSLTPLCQSGVCIYCNETLEYIYECENDTYATCTTDGTCVYGCGKTYPATGVHSLDNACEGGTCWLCWQTIEAADHIYDDTNGGKCSVCGAYRVDESLVFLQTPSLSFQEYIGMQTLIRKKLTTNYDRVYVEAIQKTPDGDVRSELEGITYLTSYLVFDQQILSWSMAEEVTLTLYAEKDGITYVGQSYTESVETLALGMLAKYKEAGTNTELCTALVDMLNYGAAVQVAYAHNETQLPNTQLEAYAEFATTTTPDMTATNEISGTDTLKVLSNNVSMQSKVEIQMLFKGDISAYTVDATKNGEEVTYEADTEFMSGYTVLRFAVRAAEMRETFTIALYDAEGNVATRVFNVSVEAYAKAFTGNNQMVAIAMLRYGDAVAAYAAITA